MQTTPENHFQYQIQEDAILITKFIGSETEIVIPEEIEGRPVKGIGKEAFLDGIDLISVVLPRDLESIAPSAFEGCRDLTIYARSDFVEDLIIVKRPCNFGVHALPVTGKRWLDLAESCEKRCRARRFTGVRA